VICHYATEIKGAVDKWTSWSDFAPEARKLTYGDDKFIVQKNPRIPGTIRGRGIAARAESENSQAHFCDAVLVARARLIELSRGRVFMMTRGESREIVSIEIQINHAG